MPKKIEMPKEELEEFIEAGMTEKEIAEHYDCAEITVKKRKQEYGLTSPRGKQSLDKKIENYILENMEDKIDQEVSTYFQQEATSTQVAPSSDEVAITIKSGDKYEIEGNSIILYNISGDCGIAASEIKSINTGVSLNLNGHIGILELIAGDRCLSVVNPIINHDNNVVVAIANYHTIDSYLIENQTPIAKLSIVKKEDVSWIK